MKTSASQPAAGETVPLVFQWEGRARARWRLAVLVALSLLVHAIGFYVLQVSYTPTGSQLPPPVQVTMVRAERADDPPEWRAQARALAHWLAVTDPSLATEPLAPETDRNPVNFVHYQPSYKAAPPPFKPLDSPGVGSAAPPPPRPPGPVPTLPAIGAGRAAGRAPGTHVVLTGGILALAPTPLPAVSLALTAGTKTLSPTVFLVGVRSEGGEPFLFREAGSGEVNADDYARDYLARLRFQPPAGTAGGTAWGWAEIDWGRDVYR